MKLHDPQAQLSTAARQRGEWTGVLFGAGLFVVWLSTAGYMVFGLGRSIDDAVRETFAPIYVAMVVLAGARWLRVRSRRGVILLDCGPSPQRWMFALSLVMFLILGMIIMFDPAANRSLGLPVIISACAMSVIAVRERLLLTEHGISIYGVWLRWDRIASIRWTNTSKLHIRTKGRFLKDVTLIVAPADRDKVDAVLAQHGATTVSRESR
jgi:hypothetical protein